MLFFFLFIIGLCFLNSAVFSQTFKLIAKLLIPIGIPPKEAKAETETYPVITKAKIRKCSI